MKTPKELKAETFRIKGIPIVIWHPSMEYLQFPETISRCLNKEETQEFLNWLMKVTMEP